MQKRRTNAEIAKVQRIHDATAEIARGISDRVDSEDISITAVSYWNARAAFQQDLADQITVSFTSRDAAVIERVARAMKEALTCPTS